MFSYFGKQNDIWREYIDFGWSKKYTKNSLMVPEGPKKSHLMKFNLKIYPVSWSSARGNYLALDAFFYT